MSKRSISKTTPETTQKKKLKPTDRTEPLGKTVSDTLLNVEEDDSFKNDLDELLGKKVIFRGSIATVYLEKNTISKEYIGHEDIANNEIAILSKCFNNNIIQLLGSQKQKMSIWVITTIYLPYYPQGSLLQLIRKCDFAYTKETRNQQKINRLNIMSQVYIQMKNAIIHLKNLKICHSDLRPANILVNNGHFVLCDFGNSKEYGTYLLSEGYCLGLPYIVPPFGIANENTITFTESYDIWSLGMVMWAVYFGIGNSDGIFMSKKNLYPYDHQVIKKEYLYHLSLVLNKVSKMKNDIKLLNTESSLRKEEKYKRYILNRFIIMLDPDQTCKMEDLP